MIKLSSYGIYLVYVYIYLYLNFLIKLEFYNVDIIAEVYLDKNF